MSYKDFVIETARGAGEIIRNGYGHVKTRHTKRDRGDIVTDIDFESERYVLDRIRSSYPGHAILSEEAGRVGESAEGYVWMIDPLDGTRNFATGIPFFSVSIALSQHGRPICGAVYDPLHDEMFYAERGQGAELNGMTMQVSSEEKLEDSVVSVSWVRKHNDHSQFVNYVSRIAQETSYFRRLGSSALISAYVAAGRADAYMQGSINPWDIAAGIILVEEAGGTTSDFAGRPIDLNRPHTDILAANPALHKAVLSEVLGD